MDTRDRNKGLDGGQSQRYRKGRARYPVVSSRPWRCMVEGMEEVLKEVPVAVASEVRRTW